MRAEILLVLLLLLAILPLSLAGWVYPSGVDGGGGIHSGGWSAPELAIDDLESTGAWGVSDNREWSAYITFDCDGVYSNRVKIFVGGALDDAMQVDVNYGGAWHNIYDGEFGDYIASPKTISFGFSKNIYKARVPHTLEDHNLLLTPPKPPVAIINANPQKIPQAPYTTELDGRASYDPDKTPIVSYEWEIDGQPAGTAPIFTHTFAKKGKH